MGVMFVPGNGGAASLDVASARDSWRGWRAAQASCGRSAGASDTRSCEKAWSNAFQGDVEVAGPSVHRPPPAVEVVGESAGLDPPMDAAPEAALVALLVDGPLRAPEWLADMARKPAANGPRYSAGGTWGSAVIWAPSTPSKDRDRGAWRWELSSPEKGLEARKW